MPISICVLAILVAATGLAAAMPLGPDVQPHTVEYSLVQEDSLHTAWPMQAHTTASTLRTELQIPTEPLDPLEALHLATLVDGDGSALFDLVWERDTGLWGLGWRLQLRYAHGDAEKPTDRTLARPVPVRGHTYETVAGYDPASGTVSYMVSDLTNGTVVHRGSVQVPAGVTGYRLTTGYLLRTGQSSTSVSLTSYELIDSFLPVGITWDVGEQTASGTILPTWRFALDRDVTVALRIPEGPVPPGNYRLLYETDAIRTELATAIESMSGARFTLPATQLPLGAGTLRLEYVADGKVLLSDAKKISIGQLQVWIDKRSLKTTEAGWHTQAVVQSSVPIEGVPLEIDAVLTEWTFDHATRRYTKASVLSHKVFGGETDVTVEGTSLPLTVPLPTHDGNWELVFSVTSPVSVTLNQLGNRLYSIPQVRGNVQVCTYNMLGFTGWPQEAAAQGIGRMSYQQRLAYFVDVLHELECDVLAVQEGLSLTWLLDLANEAEVDVALFHSPTAFPGAVFTNFPVLQQRDFTLGLRSADVPFSRTAGAVLLDINGTHVWIVNIHAHPNRQELRDAEALVLAAELDELMTVSEHVVVLGDYNSPVGTVIHNMLQEKGFLNTMELAGGGVTHTMTNLQGDGVLSIDHIYVSESLIGRVSSSRVVNDPGFRLPKAPAPDIWVHSDHLPVTAVLEL